LLAALTSAGGCEAARAQDAVSVCRDTAAAVEHALGLPPGLLLAVGRVESGRGDPSSGDVLPWPWSVNDEGEDHVFGSAFDAIAYVVAARARGSRSIDVGCFQVNLQYHPEAFADLTEAFDPAANARAAGAFLAELHGRTNSWESAVELYHSATPWRGMAYRDLVRARWAETRLAPGTLSTSAASASVGDIATVKPLAPAPVQIVMVPRAASSGPRVPMRVQYPTAAGALVANSEHAGSLPHVIVPSVYVAR